MSASSLYSPRDMDLAHEYFRAMCGHGALAAALGVPVMLVMPLFEQGGWVNIPMMKAAIANAERSARRVSEVPSEGDGVALIQWLGSWMDAKLPPHARCAYRHWVGVRRGQIWDSNFQCWMARGEWEDLTKTIYPTRATGHKIEGVWILTPEAAPRG